MGIMLDVGASEFTLPKASQHTIYWRAHKAFHRDVNYCSFGADVQARHFTKDVSVCRRYARNGRIT